MTLRWPLRIAALASIAFLLAPSFYRGWTRVETDFPNYYTAGLLARRGAPLRNFYDWTWFQRQINYSGWGMQLGSYIPHPPLAMLPILPLTALPPMTAKRVWLAMNLLFLAATIWMLASLTRLPAAGLVVLALAGYGSMGGNFELGQIYVFLLFLLTLSFWLLLSGREFSAGLVLGSIFLLKLYAGPFGLYFLWKRRWRAAAGMLLASLVLAAVAIALFGWRDNLYFITNVLPRAAVGETNDPYAPGLATPLSFLRHALMMDPDVNAHPIANVPALVFFLQPLVMLSVLVFCVISLPPSGYTDLAWFAVMMMLAATNRAFYVGVLLLLPISLLLPKATLRQRLLLIAAYLAMTIQWPESWDGFYPSMWVLIALYIALGAEYWRRLRPAIAAVAALVIVCLAMLNSQKRMDSYRREPPQKFERLLVEKDAVYSASPAVSQQGVVFESIDQERYLLKRWRNRKIDVFSFDGETFHPVVPVEGTPIFFELVSDGRSRWMEFDPDSKTLRAVATDIGSNTAYDSRATSPDGSQLAYVAGNGGTRQIWIKNLDTGAARQLTEGICNSYSPAWEPDSKSLVFASDCQRGLGLPVLFRALTNPPN